MNSNLQESNLVDVNKTTNSDVQSNVVDITDDQLSKPDDAINENCFAIRREVVPRTGGAKKVKIVDPKQQTELESDEEDSLSQQTSDERTEGASNNIPIGESANAINASEQNISAVAVDRKKTKEERKKEREKKKEEEMLKKYQAEQEAKQKISAKSKCSRWIKHNLKIGEGGYKFVYRGYDSVEARNVAWCEFKREHVDTKEKRQGMFKETEIMVKMNHPHIVRCFDVFREWIDMDDPNNQIEEKGLVIIQELMGEGTLKSIIRKNFLEGQCILKFPLITRWWHQILDSLRYMHHKIQPPILHRDLKADNCFLYGASDEAYLNVKVGDFGLATHVSNSGRKTMLGTLGFMAPEIFDEKYDEKVDIYAFGMLMLEVMTNRTPYDECESVLQVAAKTMSGQGPDIMQMVSNPSLREVISACIQPLACFRPTAEELYFHPLFQPKTLPVEVEPNYDNATDRTEVIDRFVRSLGSLETRNPNFNLRLRFRDKKMLQELGLDDGESLEFDLDIYKAEDQDIPDLIHNLRLGYEDKLWKVFENPKQPDKKIVSSHLDKLFSSIRLQMQFLVKVLLGKRWKAILDFLVEDLRARKKQEESSTIDEDNESDADSSDTSSFTIIGRFKSKWSRAKKMLEKEIQAYRNASTTTIENLDSSAVPMPAQVSTTSTVHLADTVHAPANVASIATIKNSTPPESIDNNDGLPTQASTVGESLCAIGKFTVTTPASASAAPNTGIIPTCANNGPTPFNPVATATATLHPVTKSADLAQHMMASPMSYADSIRQPPDQTHVVSVHHTVGGTSSQYVKGHVAVSNKTNSPLHTMQPSKQFNTMMDSPMPVPSNLDNATRSALRIQQVLQGMAGASNVVDSSAGLNQNVQQPLHDMHPNSVYAPDVQLSLTTQQRQLNPSSSIPPSDLILTDSTAVQNVSHVPLPTHHLSSASPTVNVSTGLVNQDSKSQFVHPNMQQGGEHHHHLHQQQQQQQQQPQQLPSYQSTLPFILQQQVQALLPTLSASNQLVLQQALATALANVVSQPSESIGQTDAHSSPKVDANMDPTLLINQLTEVLMNNPSQPRSSQPTTVHGGPVANVQNPIQSGSTTSTASVVLPPPPALLPPTCHPNQQSQQSSQMMSGVLSKLNNDRRQRKKSKLKPRYLLRITKIERDSEGCEPGNLRPTFYLEMPDLNNPNSELWKISFRCNLSDTPDDIKLFQGSGYNPANEVIDRAAKEAVMHLLEALRTDVNSVKLNQDYVFYPRNISAATTTVSTSTMTTSAVVDYPNYVSRGGIHVPGSMHSTMGSPLTTDSNVDNAMCANHPTSGLALEDNAPIYMKPIIPSHDDEDDDISDASRPHSPSEYLNYSNPMMMHHPSQVPPTVSLSSLNSQTQSFMTASSCNEACLFTADLHPDGNSNSEVIYTNQLYSQQSLPNTCCQYQSQHQPQQSTVALNPNLLNELIQLATNSLNFASNSQSGLEEIAPIQMTTSSQLDQIQTASKDVLLQPDSTQQLEQLMQRLNDQMQPTSLPPFYPAPFRSNSNMLHLDNLINLNMIIPSYLDGVVRELIGKLCACPTRAHVVIPTCQIHDSSSASNVWPVAFRVEDVPEGHMFVGTSDTTDHQHYQLYDTTVSCFPHSNQKATVLIADNQAADGKNSVPKVLKIPDNAAVILTHTGRFHILERPGLVIPVQGFADQSSPIQSPSGHDNSISATAHGRNQHPTVSSIYVRELPTLVDAENLSFDDVIGVLLALRDTSVAKHSSSASPSIDTHPNIGLYDNVKGSSMSSSMYENFNSVDAFGRRFSTHSMCNSQHCVNPMSVDGAHNYTYSHTPVFLAGQHQQQHPVMHRPHQSLHVYSNTNVDPNTQQELLGSDIRPTGKYSLPAQCDSLTPQQALSLTMKLLQQFHQQQVQQQDQWATGTNVIRDAAMGQTNSVPQLINLLNTLNRTQSHDQMTASFIKSPSFSVHPNTKSSTSSVANPSPVMPNVSNMNFFRQSRQTSSPVLLNQPGPRQTTTSQPTRSSLIHSPNHYTKQPICTSSVNTLPALLGRLLLLNASQADESIKSPNNQTTGNTQKINVVSDSLDQGNVPMIAKVSTNIHPVVGQGQQFVPGRMGPIKAVSSTTASDVPAAGGTGVGTQSPTYQLGPDLSNTLRLIQQINETSNTGINPDLQTKLLAALQQYQTQVQSSSHTSYNQFPHFNYQSQPTADMDPALFPTTNAQHLNVGPNKLSTGPFHHPRQFHPALVKDIVRASDYLLTQTPSHIMANVTTEDHLSSYQGVRSSMQTATTVANKFTVVPAKLDDDDSHQLIANVVSRPVQVAPPRPPRLARPDMTNESLMYGSHVSLTSQNASLMNFAPSQLPTTKVGKFVVENTMAGQVCLSSNPTPSITTISTISQPASTIYSTISS